MVRPIPVFLTAPLVLEPRGASVWAAPSQNGSTDSMIPGR